MYWAIGAYVPWEGHRRVEYMRALMALSDAWLCDLCGKCCKDNQGWKRHLSDDLSWVGIEFFVCGGVE